MTRIIGILNVTRDSFSDGGRYLEPEDALRRARQLLADGADIIDIGAESSHPDAEDVSADEEIARLTPVIEALLKQRRAAASRDDSAGFLLSVDTYKPEVMRHVLSLGVDLINDITGFRNTDAVAAVRDSPARLIVMHSRSRAARARRDSSTPPGANRSAPDDRSASEPSGQSHEVAAEIRSREVVDALLSFFQSRVSKLVEAGIARERLILDPGMGFFLSSAPEPSLAVLANLSSLTALGLPVCISTSRKSFIGAVLGTRADPRPTDQRAAGTLATELYAVQQGATYLRTHDVRALRDALRVIEAIRTRKHPM